MPDEKYKEDFEKNVFDEPAAAYGTEAEKLFTVEDYFALPDEQRAELIDGVFYNMSSPSLMHQAVLTELLVRFRACRDTHNLNCEIFPAPCDVRLDRDEYTMVQPDLIVTCRTCDFQKPYFEGAPDLAAEILSPSTRSKDLFLKKMKYQRAGVREYWIIDPEDRIVKIYDFEKGEDDAETYDFRSEVPVHISGGRCRIDFSGILQMLENHGC